jgi:hypothetical protein
MVKKTIFGKILDFVNRYSDWENKCLKKNIRWSIMASGGP